MFAFWIQPSVMVRSSNVTVKRAVEIIWAGSLILH